MTQVGPGLKQKVPGKMPFLKEGRSAGEEKMQ
jgi:hypothetical protein